MCGAAAHYSGSSGAHWIRRVTCRRRAVGRSRSRLFIAVPGCVTVTRQHCSRHRAVAVIGVGAFARHVVSPVQPAGVAPRVEADVALPGALGANRQPPAVFGPAVAGIGSGTSPGYRDSQPDNADNPGRPRRAARARRGRKLGRGPPVGLVCLFSAIQTVIAGRCRSYIRALGGPSRCARQRADVLDRPGLMLES
jgi:hypothetical protein